MSVPLGRILAAPGLTSVAAKFQAENRPSISPRYGAVRSRLLSVALQGRAALRVESVGPGLRRCVSHGHDDNARKDDGVASIPPLATLTGTILIAPPPLG